MKRKLFSFWLTIMSLTLALSADAKSPSVVYLGGQNTQCPNCTFCEICPICPTGPTGPTGPQGPRGIPGATGSTTGLQAYAFFYSKNQSIVPGGPAGFGIVEFEQNNPPGPVGHANINVAGFILHANDPTNPTNITSLEVPLTGDYQITFHITCLNNGNSFALVTTNGILTPGTAVNTTATVSPADFTILDPDSQGTESKEIVNTSIVHLTAGTQISIVNIDASSSKLKSNTTSAVTAGITFLYLGPGAP